jgi:photosystem II stability/assembly factor-like uncharacterized protein
MKINFYIFVIFAFIFCSCKKETTESGVDPTPLPSYKPDTLSVGWTKIVFDSTERYYDLFFQNNTIGYLSGNQIYKTTNGGLAWSVVNSNSFGNLFVTPNGNIFAAKGNDSVYRSTNGGTDFVATYMQDFSFSDVFALDNNTILTFGLNGVYNSTNGGQSWSKINPSPGAGSYCISYSTIFFRDINTGWLVNGKDVHRKINTGLGWSTYVLDTATVCHFITDIYAPSNNIVYLGDINGLFYKSTNAGQSFTVIKDFGTIGFNMDLQFIDDNIGYVSAGRKIFKTTDGGLNWTTVVSMGSALFNEIHFTDATHGWACGTKGVILKFN